MPIPARLATLLAAAVCAMPLLASPAAASGATSPSPTSSNGASRTVIAAAAMHGASGGFASAQDVPEPSTLLGTYQVAGRNTDGARFHADLVLDTVTHIERDSALGSFAIRPRDLRRLLATSDIAYFLQFRGSDGRIQLQAEARKLSATDLEFTVGVYGQGSEGPGLFGGSLVPNPNGTFTVDYFSYGVTGHLTATRTGF